MSETVKVYREIYGKRKVESLRFVGGNFDDIEKFVGGDAEFRNGKCVVASVQGPLKISEGQHIIKHKGGMIQIMDYTQLREDYEMELL